MNWTELHRKVKNNGGLFASGAGCCVSPWDCQHCLLFDTLNIMFKVKMGGTDCFNKQKEINQLLIEKSRNQKLETLLKN